MNKLKLCLVGVGSIGRRHLRQNIYAVGAAFHHAANAPDLSFDAVEAMNQPLVLFFAPFFAFMAAARFHTAPPLFCSLYTPIGYLSTVSCFFFIPLDF